MAENKAAKIARLRELRKKYKLGEFRNSRSQTKRRSIVMAKKSRRRSVKHSSFGSIATTAMGVGGYILFETLVEPKVAETLGNGLMLNVAELAAGAYFASKGGVLGSVGKAAVVINTYQILQPLLSNVRLGQ